MQFLYHKEAGLEQLELEGQSHKYLSKVRRINTAQKISLRNLKDNIKYTYEVQHIDKKRITLRLLKSEKKSTFSKKLHLGWCIVDPKSVEKTLPYLNELGVSKITFIYCQKSQQNFTLNFSRLEKILINSCQQCGRDALMELDTQKNLREFIVKNDNAYICDFGGEKIKNQEIETVIIGPEGGFGHEESAYELPKLGFDTPAILRSETAAVAVAGKILI